MPLGAKTQNRNNYGYPLVQNFTNKNFEYIGANPVYSIVQDEWGAMYFASGNSVIRYDGNSWTTYETNKVSLSLSYDSINKVIFVGCEGDFGFIKLNKDGRSVYQSLIENNNNIGAVWDCYSTTDGTFFLASDALYRFKNGKIKTWKSSGNFRSMYCIDDKIFISEKGSGILFLDNESLTYLNGSEVFSDKKIYFIGKAHSKPNEYIVAARADGLFSFDFKKENSQFYINVTQGNKNTAELFNNNIIYSGVNLPNNQIALGTLAGGLIIIDEHGNQSAHINSSNGLNSDVIYKVYKDRQGNIWLATPKGISLIMYSLPITNFSNMGNVNGNIVSINKLGETIYVGSTSGMYVLNNKNNQFEEYSFPSQQIAHVIKINDKEELMVAANKGIYIINKNGNKLLTSDFGIVTTISQSKKNKNLFYVGLENGIGVFTYENDKVRIIDCNFHVNTLINAILEDELGNLWVSTKYEGIIYVSTSTLDVNNKINYFNQVHFTTESGLPTDNANYVYQLNNEIVVATQYNLYKLNKKKSLKDYSIAELANLRFVEYSDLSPYKEKNIQIVGLNQDADNNIWFLSLKPDGRTDIGYLDIESNKKIWDNTPFKIISSDKISCIFPDSANVWLGGTDFICCFNKTKKYDYKQSYNSFISTIISNNDTVFHGNYYKVLENNIGLSKYQFSQVQPKELIVSYPYKNNNFTFYFGATSFIVDQNSKFSTFLEGEDSDWSDWNVEVFKSYMNLSEGKYVFKVKAKNIFGNESVVASYEFVIMPPWYRTITAYIIYGILAIGFVYSVVRISTQSLNRIIRNQTDELQKQNYQMSLKNKEITDSIYHAKRIQDAIMPSTEYVKNMFVDSFIFFKPKDIVSGDFYWANLKENQAIIAAVDCTGHGVPGAFMSLMGNDYLNDIVVDSKVNKPNEILNKLREGIIKALKQKGEAGEARDGMDMALVNLNLNDNMLSFAGANNPIYIVRHKSKPPINNASVFETKDSDKILFEIKGNKFPVGIHLTEKLPEFTQTNVQLYKNDCFYMFSDGYADQFGGPAGKKFKYTQLKKQILESAFLPMEEQKIYLEQKLSEWQGEHEQVDDILVIGVRIV